MGGKCNDHYAISSPIFPHSQSFSQLVHVSFGFLQTKAFAAQAEQIEDEHNYWMKEMMLYEVRYLKSSEDMILALTGHFKQLPHEPEKFRGLNGIRTHDLCDAGAVL